ncbi:hypothetical protein [Amycolatopsis sp. WQ 127309]|uniref:hypothetical protein n=1 Tax=Amycolatopsis sp. WQ 127309 TaxID=2932773 RepID=UPI001FF6509D|nr:hypothetical protein [Amycolatopsis sp. WQ 127309]UOZ06937.1 hypothetical protein MUY22_01180 [Amycolatopsis sp. WQ 127309]
MLPALFVSGIEHQSAAAIVRAALPAVRHERHRIHWLLEEHLFLDDETMAGVRVLAHWDSHLGRARMELTETSDPYLWERILTTFAEWERSGRPVTPARITEIRCSASGNPPIGVR